jgi:hypothetical protein
MVFPCKRSESGFPLCGCNAHQKDKLEVRLSRMLAGPVGELPQVSDQAKSALLKLGVLQDLLAMTKIIPWGIPSIQIGWALL